MEYTYDGVVYITDDTSRHEVTSWRIDGKDAEDAVAPAELELGGRGMHAVLVIDMSASMKTNDVAGFKSRADAVYAALLKDFAQEQVATGAAKDVVVTVILMRDTAHVELDCVPLDAHFVTSLREISCRTPRSHGNYLPALDKALEIMSADAPNRASVLLVLLSDGSPSDAWSRRCKCGIAVFDIDRKQDPNLGHINKGKAYKCRTAVHDAIKSECVDRIRAVGRVFGRDKAIVATVGFGPSDTDFKVLQEMADVLPRGAPSSRACPRSPCLATPRHDSPPSRLDSCSCRMAGTFQKLGLNASGLRTAFSSLSSSMTELRTEGGGRSLTQRTDKVVNKNQKVERSDYVEGSDGWLIYSHDELKAKFVYSSAQSGNGGGLTRTSVWSPARRAWPSSRSRFSRAPSASSSAALRSRSPSAGMRSGTMRRGCEMTRAACAPSAVASASSARRRRTRRTSKKAGPFSSPSCAYRATLPLSP
ncbi:VWA domain-containing protein [bacterium]|nr:VWA domain-containing protein [bacterium]